MLDDEAKTSYTSHFDEGLFWSGLVEAHPEFIDCVYAQILIHMTHVYTCVYTKSYMHTGARQKTTWSRTSSSF